MPATGTARQRGVALRRVLLVVGLVVLALLLAAAAGTWWLLHTESGRDFALARAERALEDLGLEYREIRGSLAGPLELDEARIDLDGTTVRAGRLMLDVAPWALLGSEVHIEELRGEDVEVVLPEETTAAEDPQADAAFELPDLQLPVGVRIDDAAIRDLTLRREGEDEPLLEARDIELAGALSREGRLTLDRLAARTEEGRLTGRSDLVLDGTPRGEAEFEWRGSGPEAPVARLSIRGDGERSEALLSLPDQDHVRLTLDGERWALEVRLGAFEPGRWVDDWEQGPLGARLDIEGVGRRARVSGEVALAGERLHIEPSTATLVEDGTALDLDPLVLVREDARVQLEGRLALDPAQPSQLTGRIEDFQLPGEEAGALAAGFAIDGTWEDYRLQADGTLVRADGAIPFELAGRGGVESMQIDALRIERDGVATLTGSGRVQWAPQLALELETEASGFDPGRLHGDWPGRLSGRIGVDARQDEDGAWDAHIELHALEGTLRDRRVRGSGTLHWGGEGARSDLRLRIGESRLRIEGIAGETLDLRVDLTPLVLSDLAPDAEGTLAGRVHVTGTRERPQAAMSLEGSGLVFAGQEIGAATIEGELPVQPDAEGRLRLQATALRLGGIDFDEALLVADGGRGAHRVALELDGDTLDAAVTLAGGLEDEGWSGTLERLRITLGERPPWQLEAPSALALRDGQLTLERTCLSGDPMTLCAELGGDRQAQHADVTLRALPLAALAPLLNADRPLPLQLEGEVSGQASMRRSGEQMTVDAELRLPQGSAALEAVETRQLLAWNDVVVLATTREGRLEVTATGVLEEQGRLDARIAGPAPWREDAAAIDGRIEIALPRLRVLELLVPHVADPQGRLAAELVVGGSWAEPALDGRVEVHELGTELPRFGVRLRDSHIVATPTGDGGFDIDARLDTGEGALQAQGRLTPTDEGLEAELALDGERVLVSDTPLARALVSPALTLRYDASGIRVDGRVAVPEASLDLERLESDISPSPDVVVVDPRQEQRNGEALALRADVEVVLGDDVTLEGFGFDGSISGTINVRERPGRVTTARGALEVSGEYTAYGQDLNIVQGRLLYSATPVDNPSLDVRAEREIGEQTVGLVIRGSAREPILDVFAEPPLDQAEAIAYLVLGRPLNDASEVDSGQLGQAAAAIGGNYLAERLGSRLGFDTFEVGDSTELGGTAFTVGKYLSPKLYVSYGVSLFGEGEILTMRYILSDRWELELESGVENRAGVNFRMER